MKGKGIYLVSSIVINIVIALLGCELVMMGLFCMVGGFMVDPTATDIMIGIAFILLSILLCLLANGVFYKVMKKKHEITKRWFLIPSAAVLLVWIGYALFSLM